MSLRIVDKSKEYVVCYFLRVLLYSLKGLQVSRDKVNIANASTREESMFD